MALAWLEPSVTTGDTLDAVVFANLHLWPLWIAPVLVAAGYAWTWHRRKTAMASLGNPGLIAKLVASVNRGNRLLIAIFTTVAMAALVVALMRPQYGGSAKVVPASGLDLVLVVDYSKSMLAKDVYPTRNERLEAELERFLDDADRRGDRVGVVVFAGRPRGFPLTRDSRMLKLYLERADPRTENPGGTAIGKALTLALTFLVDARRAEEEVAPGEQDDGPDPQNPLVDIPPAENDQAIILLTDGEDTETRPLEVAQQAGKLGVRIYSVGIGSKSGEPIQTFDENGNPTGFAKDDDGNYRMTRLDEDLLEGIAKATDGRYIRVDPEAFGLDEVRTMLEDLSRTQREDTIEINRDEGFPFGAWPALLMLALSLTLPDRRRKEDA